MRRITFLLCIALLAVSVHAPALAGARVTLLNASYDPTREFYENYNQLFIEHWKRTTGQDVSIQQSHAGSGRQARAVMDGLPADIVTLALAYDIDSIAERRQLLPANWQEQLPEHSAPYTSTIVFLVRKGNPKNIRDWGDLVRPGLQVITPSPKTSGGARWNYLAAWGYAMQKYGGQEDAARDYMRRLYANVPVLDTGARAATMTFSQRGIGDVLIAWENEALLARARIGTQPPDLIIPSVSVLAEPPVAVVEKTAVRKGTAVVAKAYLEYLYSPDAQDLIARNYFRPRSAAVAARYANRFPPLKLLRIDDFGGWKAAQAKHFNEGGVFDEIIRR